MLMPIHLKIEAWGPLARRMDELGCGVVLSHPFDRLRAGSFAKYAKGMGHPFSCHSRQTADPSTARLRHFAQDDKTCGGWKYRSRFCAVSVFDGCKYELRSRVRCFGLRGKARPCSPHGRVRTNVIRAGSFGYAQDRLFDSATLRSG